MQARQAAGLINTVTATADTLSRLLHHHHHHHHHRRRRHFRLAPLKSALAANNIQSGRFWAKSTASVSVKS